MYSKFRLLLILFVFCNGISNTFAQQERLDSLQLKLKSAAEDSLKVKILNEFVVFYRYDPEPKLKYAQLGLKLADKINYLPGSAQMLYHIGTIQMNKGLYTEALEKFKLADEIAIKLKNYKLRANIARARGLTQYNKRELVTALKSLLSAVELYRLSKQQTDIPMCYSIIASVLQDNNQLEESLKYHLLAFEKLKVLMNDKSTKYAKGDLDQFETNYVDFTTNLGNYYNNKGDFKTAINYYNLAIKKGEGSKNIRAYVIALANGSGAYYQVGNKSLADKLVRKSLAVATLNNLELEQANAMNYMGFFAKNVDSANKYFDASAKLAKSIGHMDLLVEIYTSQGAKAEELGDFRTALKAYRAHAKLKDSLTDVNQATKIAALESNFQLKESQLKVKNLEFETLKKSSRIHTILAITFGLIITILILVFFYQRLRSVNKSLILKSRQLDELNEFKLRVFSIIGHDVSGAILGMSNILIKLQQQGQKAENFDLLVKQLMVLKDNAFDMLNKLFLWGSSELGSADKTSISLPQSLESTIAMAENLAGSKQVRVNMHWDGNYQVYANRDHLEFIIRNLLFNAIKFSKRGEEIRLEINKSNSDLEISVTNNGKLLTQEALMVIFSGKIKADLANDEGLQTGLMLCKSIADRDGYKLSLSEGNASITRFVLSVPILLT